MSLARGDRRDVTDSPLATRLLVAVGAGDLEVVTAAIESATERDRRAAGERLVDRERPWRSPLRDLLGPRFGDEASPQEQAAALAVLGTAWRPSLRADIRPPLVLDEHVERVVRARGPVFASRVMKAVLPVDFPGPSFEWVRLLVGTGLVERPGDAAYLPLVMWWAGYSAHFDPKGFTARLRREPDLLEDVWKVIEQLPADAGRAWLDGDGRRSDHHHFDAVVATLRASGDMPRDRLLEVVLRTLATDCRAHVWLGGVLDDLEPTEHELPRVAATYLRVIDVPDPAAQKDGLARLAALVERGVDVHPQDLADGLRRPLLGSQKNVALAALTMLDELVAGTGGPALLLAVEALTHVRPDVQERALRLLERRWPADPAVARQVAEAIADAEPHIAAVHRGRADALRGRASGGPGDTSAPEVEIPPATELLARVRALPPEVRRDLELDAAAAAVTHGRWPAPATFRPEAAPVLAPERSIALLDDVDQLIAVWAALLEGEGGMLEVEQAIEGLARMGSAVRRDDRDRLGPLERRARELLGRSFARAPLPWSLSAAACHAVRVWFEGPTPGDRAWLATLTEPVAPTEDTRGGSMCGAPDGRTSSATPFDFVGYRMLEAAIRAGGGDAFALLAFPTHLGGWIDPAVLAERQAALEASGTPPGRLDLVAARHRVAAEEAAATRHDADLDRQLLVSHRRPTYSVPPSSPALATLATVARDLPPFRRDDPVALLLHRVATQDVGWHDPFEYQLAPVLAGAEPGTVEIATSILPRRPVLVGAAAVKEAIAGVDVDVSLRQGTSLLAGSVDPDVPLGRLGSIAVAIGLASRAAPTVAAALDVFLAAAEDGRLDPRAVGEGWALLHRSGQLTLRRLAAPLAEGLRTSPRHAVAVARCAEALLARVDDVPRDVHVVVEALVEASAATGVVVADDDARVTLTRIAASASSKRGRAARAALAAVAAADPPRLDAWRRDLLAAQLERAERWTEGAAYRSTLA